MSDDIRFDLPQSAIPRQWYNVQADLPRPLPPVLHPGTHQPVGPDDLAPLFPMQLIMQIAALSPSHPIRYNLSCPQMMARGGLRSYRPRSPARLTRNPAALAQPARYH